MIGRSAKDILIKIRGDDKDFQGALKRSDTSMSSFASSMKSYGPVIGAAFVAMGTAAAAYSVKTAMVHEQLDRGFRSLAASQGKVADEYLRKLKEVSHGTVSEVEIMQKANQAMLLGVDIDTIVQMMEGAAIIAQATGQDVGYMFESLSLGIARQSPQLLDNLGIKIKLAEATQTYADKIGVEVNSLTAEQRGLAVSEAAMAALNERTVALGGYTETAASEMAELKTTVSDAAVAFGEELVPSLTSSIKLLNDAADESDSLATKLGKLTAYPLDVSVASIRLKPLEEELAMIKNIEAAGLLSASSEKRKHEIIIEMMQIQNGEWENRLNYINEFGRTEKEIQDISIENEEHEIILMYQKMGANEAFLNTLRTELEIKKTITQEDKEQLSLVEKKAAFLARPLSAKQRSASAALSLSPLGPVGETRQSGQWTIGPSVASTRSGL